MLSNRRALAVLAAAIFMGVIAVVLAIRWTNHKILESVSPVAVASRDIDAGERLGRDNLRMVSWPLTSLVKGSAISVEALDGRVTSQAITAGYGRA